MLLDREFHGVARTCLICHLLLQFVVFITYFHFAMLFGVGFTLVLLCALLVWFGLYRRCVSGFALLCNYVLVGVIAFWTSPNLFLIGLFLSC